MSSELTNDGSCTIDARDGLTTFSLWAALMEPTHLWGPAPPPDPGGIHVHCEGGTSIDDSFDLVIVRGPRGDVELSASLARFHWLADMLGMKWQAVNCAQCDAPYVDGIEAIRLPPNVRTCVQCGCQMKTQESIVANPLSDVWNRAGLPELLPPAPVAETLTVEARDFAAIAIWPTSTELLSNEELRQPSGIHVHAWDKFGAMLIDDTYRTVRVDETIIDICTTRREAARVAFAL